MKKITFKNFIKKYFNITLSPQQHNLIARIDATLKKGQPITVKRDARGRLHVCPIAFTKSKCKIISEDESRDDGLNFSGIVVDEPIDLSF